MIVQWSVQGDAVITSIRFKKTRMVKSKRLLLHVLNIVELWLWLLSLLLLLLLLLLWLSSWSFLVWFETGATATCIVIAQLPYEDKSVGSERLGFKKGFLSFVSRRSPGRIDWDMIAQI